MLGRMMAINQSSHFLLLQLGQFFFCFLVHVHGVYGIFVHILHIRRETKTRQKCGYYVYI